MTPTHPIPLPLHTLAVNINGLDPDKWAQIAKMLIFPLLKLS